MYRIKSIALALLVCSTLTGCYHARIETGLTPSDQIIDIPFAAGWVYGLVPPSVVKASDTCTSGVAIVETEHSFVNSLVAGLTFGIFTPIHIKVTCASGGAMGMNDGRTEMNVSAGASTEDVIDTFAKAAESAVEEGQEVYIRFE